MTDYKQKYPLAVDTLTGGKFYYDQSSQMIFNEDKGMVCDVMDIRGWGWIQKLTEPEIRKDQIGEMLADFLNSLNEKAEVAETVKLIGHTTKEIGYNHCDPAPIGTPVYRDEQGYFIEFTLTKTGEKFKQRYPADGEFKFTSFK